MPKINFRSFDEGTDQTGEDLEAALEAIKLARGFNQHREAKQHIASELYPGSDKQTDDQLRQWIKDQAWTITTMAVTMMTIDLSMGVNTDGSATCP